MILKWLDDLLGGDGGMCTWKAYKKKRWQLFHSMEILAYQPTIPTLEGQILLDSILSYSILRGFEVVV